MERTFCYLVKIEHPEGCSEDYVIMDISYLPLCIKDYQLEYSVNNFYDPLDVLVKRVNFKGGNADGEGLQSSKKK